MERWEVPQRELVGTLGVTLILFLLAESVPKSAFGRARERLLLIVPITLFLIILILYLNTGSVTKTAIARQKMLSQKYPAAADGAGMKCTIHGARIR